MAFNYKMHIQSIKKLTENKKWNKFVIILTRVQNYSCFFSVVAIILILLICTVQNYYKWDGMQ